MGGLEEEEEWWLVGQVVFDDRLGFLQYCMCPQSPLQAH